MDFLREASSKLQGGGETEQTKDEQRTPPTSELFSNAKVVADATKAKMNNQEFDQHKAAEAAADILDSAEHYAKLDGTKGIGKMVDQAEDYLHKYSTTNSTAAHGGDAPHPVTTTPDESSGGGYVKMAEGLLNKDEGKKSEEGEEKSGTGILKMAGGFFK